MATHTTQMGWCEMLAWRRAMHRAKHGPEPRPDTWGDRERDPFWEEMEQERRDRRGY